MTIKNKPFKCFPNPKCKVCKNLATSIEVATTTTELVITIPEKTYNNNEALCLLIAQAVPEQCPPLPVVIAIGDNKTLYPLRTKTGHNVFSDQINSRRIYPLYAATDSQSFVYRYSINKLPYTKYPFCDKMPAVSKSESKATKNA